MGTNIKTVFDENCAHLKIDGNMATTIHRFCTAFINKNEDHVKFFGSNLTGVYPVRFKTTDLYEWYDSVIRVNDSEIKSQIVALPTIDPAWVRGTDVMNLSCLWLAHRFLTQKSLSQKDRERGIRDALMALHIKFITSLMAHYFKYPVDESIALATYAALTKKFAIKQHGSWYKVLENRCTDIVSHSSIHYRTLERFDDDGAIQYMITDIQGRLRSMIKKLWVVMEQVRSQDAKILSMGTTMTLDGREVVRDMARNFSPYKRYLHEIASDRSRFIKPELIEVCGNAVHTMPRKLFGDTLDYCVDHYSKDKHIVELYDETLVHAFDYLHHDQSVFLRSNDIGTLITKLRGMYMSSRSTDESLIKMRKLGEEIVKKATHNKNPSTLAALRTGLFLYIVTRTFALKHYN